MGKAWGPNTTRTARHHLPATSPAAGLVDEPVPGEVGFAPRPVVAREHVIDPAASVGSLPQPLGDLSGAPVVDLVEVLSNFWPGSQATKARRRAALRGITADLLGFPGDTWR